MIVVVTSSEDRPDAEVDPRFGRASWFAVVQTGSGVIEFVSNRQNLQSSQGAGIQAAQQVAELGAEWVLTGHVGPKAFAVLQRAGIKVSVSQQGSVRDAVDRLLAGQCRAIDSADVQGHW